MIIGVNLAIALYSYVANTSKQWNGRGQKLLGQSRILKFSICVRT